MEIVYISIIVFFLGWLSGSLWTANKLKERIERWCRKKGYTKDTIEDIVKELKRG